MKDYLNFIHVPRSSRQPVDHFGFQMQVMKTILSTRAQKRDRRLLDEMANRFFQEHILWGITICIQGASLAETEFYRTLFATTLRFIQLETEWFRLNEQ